MFKRPIKFLELTPKSARCLLLDVQRETTYNHRLFKKAVIGKTYYLSSEKNELIEIPDDEVEEAIESFKKEFAELVDCKKSEHERIRAECIASGRFTYSYSPWRGGVAETITEFLSEDINEFPQVMVNCLKNKVEERVLSSCCKNLTVDMIKEDELYTKLLNLAEAGDKLVWTSWDGGFLAYSAGFSLIRDGEVKCYSHQVVS